MDTELPRYASINPSAGHGEDQRLECKHIHRNLPVFVENPKSQFLSVSSWTLKCIWLFWRKLCRNDDDELCSEGIAGVRFFRGLPESRIAFPNLPSRRKEIWTSATKGERGRSTIITEFEQDTVIACQIALFGVVENWSAALAISSFSGKNQTSQVCVKWPSIQRRTESSLIKTFKLKEIIWVLWTLSFARAFLIGVLLSLTEKLLNGSARNPSAYHLRSRREGRSRKVAQLSLDHPIVDVQHNSCLFGLHLRKCFY